MELFVFQLVVLYWLVNRNYKQQLSLILPVIKLCLNSNNLLCIFFLNVHIQVSAQQFVPSGC